MCVRGGLLSPPLAGPSVSVGAVARDGQAESQISRYQSRAEPPNVHWLRPCRLSSLSCLLLPQQQRLGGGAWLFHLTRSLHLSGWLSGTPGSPNGSRGKSVSIGGEWLMQQAERG
ncbi:unnamed protein product [Lota lota]